MSPHGDEPKLTRSQCIELSQEYPNTLTLFVRKYVKAIFFVVVKQRNDISDVVHIVDVHINPLLQTHPNAIVLWANQEYVLFLIWNEEVRLLNQLIFELVKNLNTLLLVI